MDLLLSDRQKLGDDENRKQVLFAPNRPKNIATAPERSTNSGFRPEIDRQSV